MNFTSSLPARLLEDLDYYSKLLAIPKNRLLERALVAYFEKMKRVEYEYSFRKAAGDPEINSWAEEGLEDYLKMLEKE